MSWLLGVLLLAAPVRAQTAWDWSQDVIYQENHDVSVVRLNDGRNLKVNYAALSWREVDRWKKGRRLLLAYRAETGAVLFDPESGKTLSVLRDMGTHPIDILTEKCVHDHPTTLGAKACYREGSRRWEQEMDRAYAALAATLDEAPRKSVAEAQRRWLDFQEAQADAIGAVNSKQGTVWGIVAAEQQMRLFREQAERLNDQLDPL